MAQGKDTQPTDEQRKRFDRPDADTSGQYGSLDQDLGYGGGRDPGNLGHHGADATTHSHRPGEGGEELGWQSGSRPPGGDRAADEKSVAKDKDPA
jgi:hypothetical protein